MTTKNSQKELENEVLFQKLGNRWYIFTEIENEWIYSAMPEGMDPRTTKLELYNIIEGHMKRVSKHPQFRPAPAAEAS